MSSHHIVRDEQEPALIIANGQSCSFELMGQLLEWSPIVMVLDGAIHSVLELGIKIDVVLGDFDKTENWEELLANQQPVEVVHTPDQNKTDLEKGLDYLIAKGHKAVNILWATGKRADHAINNLSTLVKYKNQITIVMLDDHSRIFNLPTHFTKWYPANNNISLIPLGSVYGLTTKGLEYNLNNEVLHLGQRTSSSNKTQEDGLVTIHFESGNLLLMECND
ncbi:MAG: thiamine diphosphokinase [Bacteroidia bacterium]